ncbi:MAG: GNAT family N-acetyltransferase [Actinobacteria bacterium]|nr:GNAT family N-acetyltransferase [Actinomycetota bacterium]
MRIREANETDAARAAALWTEAYTNQNPAEGRKEPYGEDELTGAASAATVLVAESVGGEVVGIVALVPATAPRGVVARVGEAELSRLAIAAAARGDGVGRALAQRVIALARAEGAARMALWSRPYQVQAHSLYESLGFRRAPGRDGRDPLGRRLVFTLELATGG